MSIDGNDLRTLVSETQSKIAISRVFAKCATTRVLLFSEIIESAMKRVREGNERFVRKKQHARLHGINAGAIDVLLVTISEDTPFPRNKTKNLTTINFLLLRRRVAKYLKWIHEDGANDPVIIRF